MASFALNPLLLQLRIDEDEIDGAGFSGSPTQDGHTFHYSLGEFHYHLLRVDGQFQVGQSSRNDDKTFVDLVSPDLEAAERWLIYLVGGNYRMARRLPELLIPYLRDQVRSGYALEELGTREYSLRRPDGSVIPLQMRESGGRSMRIVKYSHLADLPVAQLVESYLAADAAPLLTQYLRR
ncbi:Imm61 family immunity protein [Buchananella hordeovulneris]|uniref:Uncharacterized protein n=1 Tax=Buchananella hordeovulneris TaxID=52770 RepID=A0A1Q5PUD6_9ACTO|nr:Imm61 family immunity protein [Buchananella hordeovulneris]OKL51191.1 hypothetical protein BSZ40_08910 [Buchananella hordeovulneris]